MAILQTKKIFYDRSVLYSVLDYSVDIFPLDEKQAFYVWDGIGNFSLTGFEIRWKRHNVKYVINYYLPSGLFVIVSWVSMEMKDVEKITLGLTVEFFNIKKYLILVHQIKFSFLELSTMGIWFRKVSINVISMLYFYLHTS